MLHTKLVSILILRKLTIH